jgi:hypothetical protein|tara:strand:+ start:909 stop:1151 length:243 start_codon:yes stop_codon:yes gene_type:complete
MIKNIIIIILLYLYGSLLYENRANIDILINDIETKAKAMEKGVDYLQNKFDDSNITNMTDSLDKLQEFDTEEELHESPST